jgi:signal transduction histidine kinase
LHRYPDPDVSTWLDGMNHAADLMQHTIGRLLHASAPADFPLKLDYVNVPVLLERACQYYRRIASPKHINIALDPIGDVPLAWADRVALAVVVDNLLSYAVDNSNRGGTVQVDIRSEEQQVVCRIRFGGTGLMLADKQHEFRPTSEGPGPPGSAPREPGQVGLSVAWEFADMMGGSLWFEGDSNRQTGLEFRLPCGP